MGQNTTFPWNMGFGHFFPFGGICIVVSRLREGDDSFDEHFPMRIHGVSAEGDEAVPISNGV